MIKSSSFIIDLKGLLVDDVVNGAGFIVVVVTNVVERIFGDVSSSTFR